MKTDLSASGAFAHYKTLTPHKATKEVGAKIIPGTKGLETSVPDYKVDLSSLPGALKPPAPSIKTAPDVSTLEKAKDLAKEKVKDQATRPSQHVKLSVKEGSVKKPLVLFVKGLDVFSSPLNSEGGYAGVSRMADSLKDAKVFNWDQKNEIIQEIKSTSSEYPVVLVGHSFGGDTAIEIADELDSLEHNFRAIDLLVTIDAIGLSHDIIPQNVKNHLNVFGEKDLFLNDGPHVARREEKTSVRNILTPLDHTAIDDDREVQFEILDLIKKTLRPYSETPEL